MTIRHFPQHSDIALLACLSSQHKTNPCIRGMDSTDIVCLYADVCATYGTDTLPYTVLSIRPNGDTTVQFV